MVNIIYFVAFWICQISSSILFKLGGQYPKYHWHALVLGNIILLIASWFLVELFKNVSQPIVIALCAGGTFISVQLAMALYFKISLTWIQILGICAIVTGMALVSFGDKNISS